MKKLFIFGLTLLFGMVLLGGCAKNVKSSENSEKLSSEVAQTSNEPNNGDDSGYFIWDGDKIKGLTETGKEQTELIIPDTAKSIGKSAFLLNSKLIKVSLGSGLEEIGDGAFSNCEYLTEISFPSSLKKIGNGAFYGCKRLKVVTFSEGIEEIGDGAFSDCTFFEEIKLPEGLISLGEHAFYPCTKVSAFYLPASIENIPSNVFGLGANANVYVKEGSWADLHYPEFTANYMASEDLTYIKNYY